MTNTPMTFEEWYKSHFDEDYDCEDSTSINIVERERIKDAWQASEQQNQAVIADLNAKLEWWRQL